MTRTYELRTPARTGTLTVTEHADRVDARLQFSRYGDFGDERQVIAWLAPILSRYDADPRPFVLIGEDTGQRAAIDVDDAGRPFAMLTEEPRQ